jgi:hypothetical protein
VRLDRAYHALHPLHHVGKIEVGGGGPDPELTRPPHLREQPRRADERLGGHAAGVEAIAAHAILLDERHLRFHGSGDVGRDETRRAGADDDEIAVEARGFRPARIDAARFHPFQDALRDQREDAEQRKRDDELERHPELAEPRARVDVDHGAREHADLAHPHVGPGPHRRERHEEIDREKGKSGHEPQGEEIEGALALDARVDPPEAVAEARNASVAPRVEAKDTITVPHSSPNTAPPASVITAAPGSERPVTAT